jgi:hypothetical protein
MGVLLTGALNGTATAADGLVAPGLQQAQRLDRDGLLIDPNTRIPGLVAAKTPDAELRVRPDPDAARHVAELKAKLEAAHDARAHANVALGVLVGILVLVALVTRSAYLARAAVLAPPAMVGLGLAWRSSIALFVGSMVLALLFAVPKRAFRFICGGVLAGALLVLWQWPVTNSLATIGPHPDGGRRFYGVTNQVETLLLPPALIAGLVAAPIALVAIGWSKAGADGGGLLVYAAGYATLALRAYGRVTAKRALLAAALVALLGIALVALDAATGGSSHVTRALGTGLPGDLAHRIHVSEQGVTRSFGSFVLFAIGVAILVFVARIRPRPATLDAMLVALVVSLVVNDTPQEVMFWGAFGALTILAWERTR